MGAFSEILKKQKEFNELLGATNKNRFPVGVTGVGQIHKAHYSHTLFEETGKKMLIITADDLEAIKLSYDINAMAGLQKSVVYSTRDFTFRPIESVSREFEHQRLSAILRFCSGECPIIIAPIDAVMQYIIPREDLIKKIIKIEVSVTFAPDKLGKALINAGYVRRQQVEGIGQFSIRGGIVDFFPPHENHPVRVDYWDDNPDSIAYFDIQTQRRISEIDSVLITPVCEVIFEDLNLLSQKIDGLISTVKSKNATSIIENLNKDYRKLNEGIEIASFDKYISLAYDKLVCLTDYLEADSIVIMSENTKIRDRANNFQWQQNEDIKMLFEEGILFKGLDKFSASYDEFLQIIGKTRLIFMDTFARAGYEVPPKQLINVTATMVSPWGGDVSLLVEDLQAVVDNGYTAVILSGTERGAKALSDDLRNKNMPAVFSKTFPVEPVLGLIYVTEGALTSGLEYRDLKFTLITCLHERTSTKKKKFRKKDGKQIQNLSDLIIGDYVVHISHGIGIFDGINKINMYGIVKDYIKIRYNGADTLYVPVTQLDMVSKYIGPNDNGKVKLNKLHSGEWNKARNRVKTAAKEMAQEYIKLYSERMTTKGYAFSEDNEWQREFEERFEFEETDDQLRCIEEIKEDMQSDSPMERLLCGDVGFGKTEVALRGAFKCVLDSKQCAILVPTTILAWQHFQTLIKRMGYFPINIELLSRFRTPKQQSEIIKKLKTGEIDIVVGTHRLVQKDIEFKDLGLAIIDEEQRFGVTHKEKFKEMFRGVDLLTLSATPIPRTLSMTLSGIRDMSVIEEAPGDRHPIQTYVLEQDYGIISDAIKKELRRGGQVYYIHNRIDTIQRCAAKILELVPEARVVFAHGQMKEGELSDVWQRLINHEIDILVCTTIIEIGVDVANCNTLIIEDADNMGLSQLYQLRGRVGRSSRRAFAYFTFKKGKVLTETSSKRLEAIREFTAFGSGFKIALRDLEIRGAGNIIGAKQHGHMEAVGYDMYLRLLSDAIAEEKGEPTQTLIECLIDIRIEAHIPDKYISNIQQRLEIYKRIASIRSEDDSTDVIDELIDRFGEPPKAVLGLIDVALLRNTAAKLSITEITEKNDVLVFSSEQMDLKIASKLAQELRGRVMVNASVKPYFTVKMNKGQQAIDTMREVLTAMTKE